MKTHAHTTKRRKPTSVRRLEIIEAGIRILASEGARRFTAEQLGKAIGITDGTVFRHFASMDEILDSIIDRIDEIIFADFPPQADDPLESLRQFFETRVEVIASRPEISTLLLTDALIPNATDGDREKRLRNLKRRSRTFVLARLRNAQKRGLLADGVSPDDGVVLVLGAIYAIGHMGVRTAKTKDVHMQARRTWKLIETVLRGKE